MSKYLEKDQSDHENDVMHLNHVVYTPVMWHENRSCSMHTDHELMHLNNDMHTDHEVLQSYRS